jgi:hypothetical protein
MSAAFVVVAGLIVLVVVLFAWDRGGGGESPTALDAAPIEARADLSPRSVLFGDTVTALVEVTLDRNRVDPDSVRIVTDFSPWKRVANPERLRRDGETTTHLRMSFALRCLASFCTSASEGAVQDFAQARVTYTPREGADSSADGSLEVPWPELAVGSRFSATPPQGPDIVASRWRADMLSQPAVSYSIGPTLLIGLLLVGGALLAVGGGTLAYVALPHRSRAPRPKAEPTEPLLTPLELALALLEDPARVDGAGDQRRALELVAAGLVERGDVKLGQAARTLAWSKPVPRVAETSGLAARARSVLGQELREHPA